MDGGVGVVLLTPLGSPSLTSPAPTFSANLSAPNPLSPPLDDLSAGVSFAMGLVDSCGKSRHVCRSFKLRPILIAFAILIIAHLIGLLKLQKL